MKVYLVAGEASGDKLGAALIQGLKSLVPDLQLRGVAGHLMQAEGMTSLFPMNELSVMGLAEILPKFRHLVRRIEETASDIVDHAPDVLITIDSPDFCHRVARKVRAKAPGIRIVHYVAPSVWAWRKGRAQKMAGHVDQVLALLPFEPPFMEGAGISCDFVGHPITAEVQISAKEAAGFRADHGLGDTPVLMILPGSRSGEVSRLAPVFAAALARIIAEKPDLRVVVPAAHGVAEAVLAATANWPGTPVVLDPRGMGAEAAEHRKRVAMKAADLAIAASGTVSLELAAAATPMVIAYDMNWLSWQIISRMVKLDTVTLVNLVTGRNTIPEFLGPKCEPASIAEAVLGLMSDEFKREAQLSAMRDCMQALGQGGEAPGLRAAKAVLAGLRKETS